MFSTDETHLSSSTTGSLKGNGRRGLDLERSAGKNNSYSFSGFQETDFHDGIVASSACGSRD